MDDYKSVTESLYKQNMEIAFKNRTLSLLSELYKISLLPFSPIELSKEVGQIIKIGLDFELVGIFLYKNKDDTLVPLGISMSDRFQEAERKYSYFIENSTMRSIVKSPFYRPIFLEKKMNTSVDMGDVFQMAASREILNKIQAEGHLKSLMAFPLTVRNNVIGLLIMGFNRGYEDLTEHENETLNSLINVVSVALDKALLYEELRVTNEELADANIRQEGLIHFISHEIKGFLTKNLAVFAGIKEGDYGNITPELLHTSEYSLIDTKKGVETVMDILNASNLKKGTISFRFSEFEIVSSIKNVVDRLKPDALEKKLELQLNIDIDDKTIYKGDKDQLEKHVFRNLIDNAIKYTPKGLVIIHLNQNENKILFSVKDSGVGITDEDKKKLFTEGGRGKESTLVNVNSTGYGLFIAKQIVKAHNGKIWAESEGKGKGSTFFVEL